MKSEMMLFMMLGKLMLKACGKTMAICVFQYPNLGGQETANYWTDLVTGNLTYRLHYATWVEPANLVMPVLGNDFSTANLQASAQKMLDRMEAQADGQDWFLEAYKERVTSKLITDGGNLDSLRDDLDTGRQWWHSIATLTPIWQSSRPTPAIP